MIKLNCASKQKELYNVRASPCVKFIIFILDQCSKSPQVP